MKKVPCLLHSLKNILNLIFFANVIIYYWDVNTYHSSSQKLLCSSVRSDCIKQFMIVDETYENYYVSFP